MLSQERQNVSASDGQSLSSLTVLPSFDDGNLILHAGGHAVRVHAGLSASRSRSLAQQLSHSATGTDTGIRAIEVRRGADLPLLLQCLYQANPLSWSWDPETAPPSLSHIAALSDIATCYDMPELRQAVITHLDLIFPPDLTDYAGALRAHLIPSDWDPLVVWDLVTKHNLPQMRYPHVGTLALLAAATSVGEDTEDQVKMEEDNNDEECCPSSDAIRARDAFRAHMLSSLHAAFATGAIGLEWPAMPCPNVGCGWEAAHDVTERRYRSLAFDVCSDLAEDIVGNGELLDALCPSCREALPRAGERLREQVWAWLCREDGEELEDPFVLG
ncbi:unnamed protein product [Peniophora sp. CBMAI 1063]|nr:unnamed protein product [Peniophora sp. CBMAI 1063]